jgi:hypothetical protein
MRVIKLAVLSFFFLFLLVTLISLFIPSHLRISKAINVIATDEQVLFYTGNLPEWKRWHPALKNIPGNEISFKEDSSLFVKGSSIRVVEKRPDEIITDIIAEGGRPVISGMKLIHHDQSDSLTIQWYLDFSLRWYPWEKFKSLFYENVYGVQMEQGLANLKELLEGNHSSIKK